MEKKKFNFKKFGLVLCVCFITLFAFIPFANFNNIGSVSADEVETEYTFSASDIVCCAASYYNPTDRTSFWGVGLFGFVISTNSDGVTFRIKGALNSRYNNDEGSIYSFDSSFVYSVSQYYSPTLIDATGFNVPVSVLVSSPDFIANIYKIRIYTEDLSSYNFNTHIVYYDVNDNFIDFAVLMDNRFGASQPLALKLSDRTYFLVSDLTGDQMYSQGYQEGLLANQDNIYNSGYNVGRLEGYDDGYNSGINDSNQYSFYNLFGAVLDAPVKVFSGLFNFNLLGINLLGLITGLFTLAMIILIIKLILGGK